jgi:hypothetical protein
LELQVFITGHDQGPQVPPNGPPMGPQWAPSGARPRALAQNGCKKIENDRNYAHKYQIC